MKFRNPRAEKNLPGSKRKREMKRGGVVPVRGPRRREWESVSGVQVKSDGIEQQALF